MASESLIQIAVELGGLARLESRSQHLARAVRNVVSAEVVLILEKSNERLSVLAAEGVGDGVHRLEGQPPDSHPILINGHDASIPRAIRWNRAKAHPWADCLDVANPITEELIWFRRIDATVYRFVSLLTTRPEGFTEIDRHRFSRLCMVFQKSLGGHPSVMSLPPHEGEPRIVGTSQAVEALHADIASVARSDIPVLITGDTGVGKELAARCIHSASPRAEAPLVVVNCGALSEGLAESELFGHVEGAFTGAVRPRAGHFARADRGTLFLDEVGELTTAVQAKLLRSLQFGELQPVGTDEVRTADVRVIALTNRDLENEVSAGRFRADLYHRLNGYRIRVPPLRERLDDLQTLIEDIQRVDTRGGAALPVRLTTAAMDRLRAHSWPGNIRELKHVIRRALLVARSTRTNGVVQLDVDHLVFDEPLPGDSLESMAFNDAVAAFQRKMVLSALEEGEHNWNEAARRLQMDPSNLHRVARRLGLKRNG